jgi:hypothetical protein
VNTSLTLLSEILELDLPVKLLACTLYMRTCIIQNFFIKFREKSIYMLILLVLQKYPKTMLFFIALYFVIL